MRHIGSGRTLVRGGQGRSTEDTIHAVLNIGAAILIAVSLVLLAVMGGG